MDHARRRHRLQGRLPLARRTPGAWRPTAGEATARDRRSRTTADATAACALAGWEVVRFTWRDVEREPGGGDRDPRSPVGSAKRDDAWEARRRTRAGRCGARRRARPSLPTPLRPHHGRQVRLRHNPARPPAPPPASLASAAAWPQIRQSSAGAFGRATARRLPRRSTRSRTARIGRPPRRSSRRCLRPSSAARRRRTWSGSPGRPGPASRRCCPRSSRSGAERGRTVAVLAVDPSSKRSGGSLLGDRARIEHDPRDDGVLIRSTAAGGRLGGLAIPTREAADALAAAFDVVVVETVGVGQSETDVEEVCDSVVGGGTAGLRRRASVPQGRDHGGARRAGGDEGRPGRCRAARPARPRAGPGRARVERRAGDAGLLGAAAERDPRARRRAGGPPRPDRRGRTPPARTPGIGAAGSSRRSTARARCGPWAAGARPSASWRPRSRAPTCPR